MDELYLSFDKSLHRISDAKTANVSDEIDPDRITSGSSVSSVTQTLGSIQSGKLTFSNDENGYILGLDQGVGKLYVGTPTSYLNFDGTNVIISGSITASSGTIGGFTIGSDYLRDTANTFGLASTVTGGDDVRFWAGDTFANRATADFRVTEAGVVTSSNFNMTGGAITGGTLDIGGSDATSLHFDADGNLWLGAATFNIATNPFAVSNAGVLRAVSGTIGGWTLATDKLYAGTDSDYIALIPGTGIQMGDSTFGDAEFSVTNAGVLKAVSGTIGGCVLSTTSIGSTTFVSGPLGSGWNISNTGTAEFQDATIRGIIRTSVFEKDTISCVNGIVLVSSSDVLGADMTALDASTLTISGQTTFSANEVIRIKDGTDDEWMLVTNAASAPTYTVTRDLAGSYSSNANPIWKKGTAVVSMGVGTGSKTGFVLMDSSSANSPYIDVYGRNSNTYTDYTLHGRFGWLKGITDADLGLSSTDIWGLYTDNGYFKGSIYGSTITGGTIQTATTGQRLVMDSTGLTGYDSGAYTIFKLNPTTGAGAGDVIYINLPVGSSPNYGIDLGVQTDAISMWVDKRSYNSAMNANSVDFTSKLYIADGNGYANGGNTVSIQRNNMQTWDSGHVVKAGTLVLDLSTNTYTGTTAKTYIVKIDGAGSPNTFKWSDDNGSTWEATEVAITGTEQTLNNGYKITFSSTTGGVVDDYWTWDSGYVDGDTGYCLELKNDVPYATGNVIDITNAGTGYDIDGTSSTWFVTKAGAGTFNSLALTTDLAVEHGGTGKSSWTQYLIPYADTTTSFSQIAIGTDGQVLTSNGAGSAPSFQDASGGVVFAADSGTTDTYAVTFSPALADYTEGQIVMFRPNVGNTGAATLNANSLGALTIKKYYDEDLEDGDLISGEPVLVATSRVASDVVIDSYLESNYDTDLRVGDGGGTNKITRCQSFKIRGGSYKLKSVKFYLRRHGTPNSGNDGGLCYAVIYKAIGTHGTDAIPNTAATAVTGALATSDAKATGDIGTASFVLTELTFPPDEQITLEKDQVYCVGFRSANGDANNYFDIGTDGSSPSHEGNQSYIIWGGTWGYTTLQDICFYVYGDVVQTWQLLSNLNPKTEELMGVGTYQNNKNWNFVLPFSCGDFWTDDSTTITYAIASVTTVPDADSAWAMYTTNPIFSPYPQYADLDGRTISFEVGVKFAGAGTTENGFFGLGKRNLAFQTYTSGDGGVGFSYYNGNLYAHSSDDSTYTNTQISGITMTNLNTYRVEYEEGVVCKFYVNGVLKATHWTVLPNNVAIDILFGFGGTGNNWYPNKVTTPYFSITK